MHCAETNEGKLCYPLSRWRKVITIQSTQQNTNLFYYIVYFLRKDLVIKVNLRLFEQKCVKHVIQTRIKKNCTFAATKWQSKF